MNGPAVTGALAPTRRRVVATVATAVAVVVLAVVAMGLGDYPLSVPEVLAAIVSDQGFATRIVLEWRLPRVVAALLFGAALAASGALFQTLTRNPLGSPDIIGFSTGAYTGAIVVITLGAGGVVSTAAGALVGGLLTAGAVYLLSWRGGSQGFRLIIVGIAVSAVLASTNTYLLLRAQAEVAMTASIWGAGSLATVGWHQVAVAGAAIAVLAVATAALVPPLRQLELGDDTARAHGVRTEVVRVGVLFVGVALIAVVTAISGPIAFIALSAPQIARRLGRTAGIPIVLSAIVGAFLLIAADVVAQHVLPGAVPVGVVTVVVGGAYLVALLVREARKHW